MFNFEKLDVWRKSVDFAALVSRLTQLFPVEVAMTNQMRRACASISSNIAEGGSRSSRINYSRFVEVAAGSLFEVVSRAYIAFRQSDLSEENFQRVPASAEEPSRILSGLRTYLGKGIE